ncbi:TATA-binding protein-associated factor mot1 [Tulasnella sp. 330]|nr:TATA-binding protein-associated factor mot1 [Tulasnella sp. 330]KAG8885224.1 TATA-binding protein-associated factor mot1 [Tulasnella sp. 332]
MSLSRLDRLLLLLDTGSSPAVRAAAARQVAQIAAKTVNEDVPTEPSIEPSSTTAVHIWHASPASDWTEVLAVVRRLLPYLHSKSFDTRTAACNALSQICTLVPVWKPRSAPDDMATESRDSTPPSFPPFSIQKILQTSALLLASSGKEFNKPLESSQDIASARKEAMGRLGLDFFEDNDGLVKDLEKELAGGDEEEEVKMSELKIESTDGSGGAPSGTPGTPASTLVKVESLDVPPTSDVKMEGSTTPPPTSMSPAPGKELSRREMNRLKRKRKDGNAFVGAIASSAAAAKAAQMETAPPATKLRKTEPDGPSIKPNPSPTPETAQTSSASLSDEKVIVDPQKGGQVAASDKSAQVNLLQVPEGHWVWGRLVEVLEVDLVSPNWEVRHGAATALREVIKTQGSGGGMIDNKTPEENDLNHENWCNQLAAKFLLVFVLDRFSDFVSDMMVAPVRETVSQSLASLLIHMPRRSIIHVHNVLLDMIFQRQGAPDGLPQIANGNGYGHGPVNGKGNGKGNGNGGRSPSMNHVWQVRHAGLLGMKYEVAVRSDLVDEEQGGKEILKGVVEAALLGLGDQDDDVRSVAASCLTPIAQQIVERLPEELGAVMDVLWNCLADMKDDLGSSVGAVMDLLGKLVSFPQVIELLSSSSSSRPLTTLAPILSPFFRHVISNVRLAVVKTLLNFLSVPSLIGAWISQDFIRLLFQNLVMEERSDVREVTFSAWKLSIGALSRMDTSLDVEGGGGGMIGLGLSVIPPSLLSWFTILMSPVGTPLDPSLFYQAVKSGAQAHNVDKPMMMQDLSLVTEEAILRGRVLGAKAIAYVMSVWPVQVGPPITPGWLSQILVLINPLTPSAVQSQHETFHYWLTFYDISRSMLQRYLAATIVQEWAIAIDEATESPSPSQQLPSLTLSSPLAAELAARLNTHIEVDLTAPYHELLHELGRLSTDCKDLLAAFTSDAKIPTSKIPGVPTELDVTGSDPTKFSVTTAHQVVGPVFNGLRGSVKQQTRKKEVASLEDRKAKIVAGIEKYETMKKAFDTRVTAGCAAAIVALRALPEKKNTVIRGVMDGTKYEENADLQERSALAVVALVAHIAPLHLTTKVNPAEKVVKNLCTFVCADGSLTPVFADSTHLLNGIASNKRPLPAAAAARGRKPAIPKVEVVELEKMSPEKLQRRGALMALSNFGERMGPQLFERLPKLWQRMASGLMDTYSSDTLASVADDTENGQTIVDELTVIQGVAPHLHPELLPHMTTLFPYILGALKSQYAVIRQCAARCIATLCDVFTTDAMRFVVEHVIPRLGDPVVLSNRQGAMELIAMIIQLLDIKALPYVIFLIVPVLGRMSDADDDVRFSATHTFAALVKMVPLEAGIPDPPGFSQELLQKRASERQFLAQLLDGSKVEPYKIPITVNAELRKYQQEGVNWLAFLAKYQLHGVLCDDMGLGKTLQSICILASTHHERAERWKADKSMDSVHLPSLIICPPTLTGHWYHEILKYVDNLKPIQYVGTSRYRSHLANTLSKYDVVITSYDVVRNDVTALSLMNWHYCILDEGHIIKNPKTMLTKAVKSMRANHRLILSGTPIQNNVLELWSLFDFLMPGFLGTESSFGERFSRPILANRDAKNGGKAAEAAAAALEALHKQVLPFLLRRLKEDVLSDLPPKIIQDYYCDLSDLQKALYDEYTNSQAQAAVAEAVQSQGKSGGGQTHVFQALQYLRKLCNHPALVIKSPTEAAEVARKHRVQLGPKGLRDIVHAPKIEALRQLLNDCGIGCPKDEESQEASDTAGTFSRHRVLIFCQMKQMLEMIETDLFQALMPEVTYMRLDGTVDAGKRHATVQTFNADPSIDCLLLTTHVGGLGLTLTGADTVIFMEHDWNPMKDLQAMDRAHRLGQKKVVNVYRLITKGTLEEKIMGLQRFKLNIANSVVTQQNAGLASMDTDLVLDLFRRTTEDEDAKNKKKQKELDNKPSSQKNVLDGLEDLPAEEEYDSLDLGSFLGSLKKT